MTVVAKVFYLRALKEPALWPELYCANYLDPKNSNFFGQKILIANNGPNYISKH